MAWTHRLLLGPGGRVALIGGLLLGHATWSFVQTRAKKNSFRHLEDEARYALQLRAQALAGGLRGVNAAAEHVLLAVYVGEGAHESGGDDEDRRRRVDRGLRHQALEHARAETGQIGEHPADAEEAHLIPLERHAEGEAHRLGLGDQQIQERVDEIVDQLPSRVAGLQVPHDGVARAIAETREYRFPELLLAPPMVVERPERHVRPARDVPHRGARVAFGGEHVLGRVEDARGGTAGVLTGLVEHLLPHWSPDLVIRPRRHPCQAGPGRESGSAVAAVRTAVTKDVFFAISDNFWSYLRRDRGHDQRAVRTSP